MTESGDAHEYGGQGIESADGTEASYDAYGLPCLSAPSSTVAN